MGGGGDPFAVLADGVVLFLVAPFQGADAGGLLSPGLRSLRSLTLGYHLVRLQRTVASLPDPGLPPCALSAHCRFAP
jgi:hypothetical protein